MCNQWELCGGVHAMGAVLNGSCNERCVREFLQMGGVLKCSCNGRCVNYFVLY